MRKRPLHILSVVSAVICLLSLLLVGRSFVYSDTLWIPIGNDIDGWATTMDAQLLLYYAPPLRPYSAQSRQVEYRIGGTSAYRPNYSLMWQDLTGIRALGIGWGTNVGYVGFHVLILPLWLVPVVTAVLPVRWWVLRRRAVRRGFPVEVKAAGGDVAADAE